MSNRKKDSMRASTATLCITALLAAGCSPAKTSKQDAPMTTTIKDPITKEDWHRAMTTDDFGTDPTLLDAERGIYRFTGGACRDLKKTTFPYEKSISSLGKLLFLQ